jgi:hypothetical protein
MTPTVEELIAEDPELAALSADYQKALQIWTENLFCEALSSGTLLTRIRASVLSANGPPSACPGLGNIEPGIIRHDALIEGWDDPAVVYRVYRHGCTDPEKGDACDPGRLNDRLRVIDGDNIAVYFLPLVRPNDVRQAVRLEWTPGDSEWERGRKALLDAVDADTFDLYLTAGRYDAYLQARNFGKAHPVPVPPAEILALYGDDDPATDIYAAMTGDAGWLGSLMLGHSDTEVLGLSAWHAVWAGLCTRAARSGDDEASAACAHIADVLIASPNVPIKSNPGHAIHSILDDPSTAVAGGLTDSVASSLRSLVYACEFPKHLSFPIPSAQVPENHFEQWERDLQNLGERDAIRQAAIREYAIDPDAFVVDPARCRDALELDEATQRGIVEAFRPEGSTSSSMEAGLAALAEALES